MLHPVGKERKGFSKEGIALLGFKEVRSFDSAGSESKGIKTLS